MKKLLVILVLLLALVAACKPTPTPTDTSKPPTHTPTPTDTSRPPTSTPTPTNTPRPPTPTPTPTPTPIPCGPHAILSEQAGDYIGQIVTVHIDRAYCSYRPDVKGSPTFCNDAPYPIHDFTMLVWGQDWSDYDGRCICVYGKVTPYKGKPQIVLGSRSDVSVCR